MNIKLTPIESKDLIGFEMDVRGEIHKQVASLQDQIVTQQLEKAGWLSPKATAELRAQVEALTYDAAAGSFAKRLALELECLLLDTKDTAKLSKWWSSALEALGQYQKGLDALPEPQPLTRPAVPDPDDSLLLCVSDLQHSAIYDNHAEMQSCIRSVADRIKAFAASKQPDQAAAPAVPEGWKLVPVEPTTAMKAAGVLDVGDSEELCLTWDELVTIYRAMLSATPQPEQKGGA